MRSLTRIPRLRRLRPAIDASLDRVAAHDDPPQARLGPKPARPDQTDREIGQPGPQPIWDPNPISKTRSGSSQRAGGEQCTPVLVKVRHGLMTSNRRRSKFLRNRFAMTQDSPLDADTPENHLGMDGASEG
jgi:hypothetical protein